MYFGEGSNDASFRKKILLGYLRSPIFIAVLSGLLVSRLHINPNQRFLAPFFEASNMVDSSITILACLILGIQLNFRSPRGLVPLVIISVAIEMCLLPFLASLQATLFHLSLEQRQVLVFEAAMPPAILNSVFATQYKCDSATTSEPVFISVILSMLTLPVIFYLLGN